MKIIFIISRIMFIAFIWTIGYMFWFRQLMIAMWGFDPLASTHWEYIYGQWRSGWVIQTPREWMFVIALFAMIPLWFIGWTILSSISWMSWFKAILLFPIKLIKSKMNTSQKSVRKPKVTKKKSYKQTRPPAIRTASGKIKPIEKAPEEEKEHRHKPEPVHHQEPQQAQTPKYTEPAPAPKKETPKPKTTTTSGGTIEDILLSAGYKLIQNAKISGKPVDYIGVSEDHILLCLVDSEHGDWLADEERFNDEEPLWFSESNHRISPVRIILNARDALMPQLSGKARGMEIKPMVIVKQGTIINAEDMFEVWDGLNVSVCRFDEGGPEEIQDLRTSLERVEPAEDAVYQEVSSALD